MLTLTLTLISDLSPPGGSKEAKKGKRIIFRAREPAGFVSV